MNILGPIFISALAAALFVYGAPLQSTEIQLTEVQPEQAKLQNAVVKSEAPFAVDAFYGRESNTGREVRVIVASPYCR